MMYLLICILLEFEKKNKKKLQVFSSPDTTHEQGFSPVNFFYNCPNFHLPIISLVIKI